MKKLITFGEIMMRLNPPGYLRLVQAQSFEVSYAGGEANVAVSLANYGMNSSFVTKLPENTLGNCAINELRRFGVDTCDIVRGGPRLGIYFLEKGASQRASIVCYDRVGSSIALAKRTDFDWDRIFEGAEWFHFTGITPALGGELPDICMDACEAAKGKGLTVSCDLNYRKSLWTQEQASKTMSVLMRHIDVCVANEEDALDVFGIAAENTDIVGGRLSQSGYCSVAEQISHKFNIPRVAITLRSSISANDNEWSGLLYDKGVCYFAPNYHIHIVDRVGSGDSFAAGIIYALVSGYDPKETIDFAVAASCLKHTVERDFNMMSTSEIQTLVSGDASGRVRR